MNPDYIIFSDGSVRPGGAGYGTVVIDVKTMNYTSFGGELWTKSIAFAEGWAFLRGLQYINGVCRKTKTKHPTVFIITDNKLSVDIFETYIPKKWDLSNPKIWKKSDGSMVKNQELYRAILNLITEHGITVRFIHMNSHLQPWNWMLIQEKVWMQTHVMLSDDACKKFLEMNAIADDIATSYSATTPEKEYLNQNKIRLVWKNKQPDEDD